MVALPQIVNMAHDLTGRVFGLLTVLSEEPSGVYTNGARYARWLCGCSCSAKSTKIVSANSLRSGRSTSCGCVRKAAAIAMGARRRKYFTQSGSTTR